MDLMPELIPFTPTRTGIKGSQSHFEGLITFQRTLTLQATCVYALSSSALQQKAPLRYGRSVETFTTLPYIGILLPMVLVLGLINENTSEPTAKAPDRCQTPPRRGVMRPSHQNPTRRSCG